MSAARGLIDVVDSLKRRAVYESKENQFFIDYNRVVLYSQIGCKDFKSSKKSLGLLDFFRIFFGVRGFYE